MNSTQVLDLSSQHLANLSGHVFDVLSIAKPVSSDASLNLAKIISKLSPIVGNLIEFNAVEFLNDLVDLGDLGEWVRQDPGFPDAVFSGVVSPMPGFEIKAWFPLATEITARFKDSQNHLLEDNTRVCLLAWLPEYLIYGRPRIVDVCIVSGLSVAKARDDHYHNPPRYLVLEPGDTSGRTRNLQQTNTLGFRWQGTPAQLEEAQRLVESWGRIGQIYQPTPEYQVLLRELMSRYPYRGDTNFAKMDRIVHTGIEDFKLQVLGSEFNDRPILEWSRLLASGNNELIKRVLSDSWDISEVEVEQILE